MIFFLLSDKIWNNPADFLNKSHKSEDRDPVVNRITLTKKKILKKWLSFRIIHSILRPKKKHLEIRYIGEDRYILSNWDK